MKKIRIDQYLVEKRLCETRTQAQAIIRAGDVLVNEVVVDKPGQTIVADAAVRVRGGVKYVSRGGLKLEKALSEFHIDAADSVCLDVGASTGGFTDCLLQHGAHKVYAIDVGYGQLHWRLQTDPRVVRLDRENFRTFDVTRLTELIDICVVDVSFISLKLIIPKIVEVFQRDIQKSRPARLICLIKPQFEVGPEHVGKGGIVRDDSVRERCVAEIFEFAGKQGFFDLTTTASPIKGGDGNEEELFFGVWKE